MENKAQGEDMLAVLRFLAIGYTMESEILNEVQVLGR